MKKSDVEKIIQDAINANLETIKEHDQIKAILKPLQGKPINGQTLNSKRLAAFENENGFPFRFVSEYSMFYIKGKFTHLIGYKTSENTIQIKSVEGESRGFEYFDSCNGSAAIERINKLKSLDIDKVTSIFSKIDYHFNRLRELFGDIEREKLGSFENPIYYNLLQFIYPENQKNRNEVDLFKFYFIRK